jgi:hypothetical protein
MYCLLQFLLDLQESHRKKQIVLPNLSILSLKKAYILFSVAEEYYYEY